MSWSANNFNMTKDSNNLSGETVSGTAHSSTVGGDSIISYNIITSGSSYNDNYNNNNNTFFNTSASLNNASVNVTPVFYPLLKQPLSMTIFLSTIYGLVFLCAVMGNLCVLCVVIKDRNFHSPVYFLIGNLAVADLIVAVLCHPLTLLTNLYNGWQFGAFMCKALPYLQAVAVCASVNTLVVIAVDRYLAICHVMRQRNTKNMARVVLVVIWLVAFALMTPWALYFKMEMYVSQVQKIDMCVEVFPEVWQKKAFFLGVIFLMCYALPLAFIIACYFMIGYRVWHRDAPGITSSMGVIEKSKVRVVKMLVVVVVLFTVSWMPLYIIRLIILFADISESSPQSAIIHNIVFPFAQWLGTSNCCMNPLVYCLFSQKIRRRIRAMLCCSKPELRSLYSNRSMYSNALQHSTNTRDSTVRQEHTGSGYSNGHAGYGHHYGGGNLYHHRSARSDTEFIRLHRNSNVRSTHV